MVKKTRAAVQLPLTHLTYHILLALADQDLHGYAIIQEIEAKSGGTLRPTTGALYLALQRMEEEGLVRESPRRPEPGEDARRRYYRMTREGRSVARAESERLAALLGVAFEQRLVGEGPWSGALRRGRGRDGK
jgi:DNA-binding PadR family transcriptional regulator